MSDTDSFIDEVNEELRRDKLYATFRRYGWIAALVILAIVGGAAYSEINKANARAKAEALGDALIDALDEQNPDARTAAFSQIAPEMPEARAVKTMLEATSVETDQADVVAELTALANNVNVPEIYRQIALFKSLTLQSETLAIEDRKQGFSDLAVPGEPLRLLAEEQLALIAIEEGETEAAIAAYQSILADADATPDLQQRGSQVIVALGGEPDFAGSPDLTEDHGG